MKIEKIDENFQAAPCASSGNVKFYDCRDACFEINELLYSEAGGCFCRMPQNIADETNEGVSTLNLHTAGGRLRFKTNASYICITAYMTEMSKMPHMAFTGSIGFDLYEYAHGKEKYINSFVPPVDITEKFESKIDLGEPTERELVINFPLYSGVKKLLVGLPEGASISKPHRYTYDVPVVYYGSSITQGGCASRPGNSYQSMISRRLDCDYVNLGFSGSARGERAIADYISNLKMSVFVYDYDHNAPSPQYLQETHKPMFDIIRNANPDLPIVIVSRPDISELDDTHSRFAIIKDTYDCAKSKNDDNVYLIDGRKIMCGVAEDSGTVDGIHPNDLGFYSMAVNIGDVIEKIIKR